MICLKIISKQSPLKFFPPKLTTPIETIFDKLGDFASMKPDFISVTYGAGGQKKEESVEIASKIKGNMGLKVLLILLVSGTLLRNKSLIRK